MKILDRVSYNFLEKNYSTRKIFKIFLTGRDLKANYDKLELQSVISPRRNGYAHFPIFRNLQFVPIDQYTRGAH